MQKTIDPTCPRFEWLSMTQLEPGTILRSVCRKQLCVEEPKARLASVDVWLWQDSDMVARTITTSRLLLDDSKSWQKARRGRRDAEAEMQKDAEGRRRQNEPSGKP